MAFPQESIWITTNKTINTLLVKHFLKSDSNIVKASNNGMAPQSTRLILKT